MTIKYSDSGFLDGADETKKLSFDVSGVTTGTTRTITMPDGDTKLYTGDGTSGQVLTSGGAGVAPTFQAAAGGGLASQQVFTSSGTWTKPSGITLVKVYVTGGGGGGCNTSGGGGAGGGTAIEIIDVSAISSETVTIGSGGADGSTGATGGTSSFGSHCSATGGGGGTAESGGGAYPGAGGAGSGGDINLVGQGATTNETSRGGATYWGAGGAGARNDGTYSHGGAGSQYGGGGGGAFGSNFTGDGGAGIVVVEEYK